MINVAYSFEEVINNPVVKKCINKFKVDHREKAGEYFYKTFIRHFNAWDSEERQEQHSLYNIKKVEWNRKENCFHVHYKKTKYFGETWYHYTNGRWY
ncbi:hypothetical protein P9E34_19770 [Schinkia azotoformans]|uniref:hypothetical protein n=1 Tax=Schinkia azotoformans TaxID=1454 RepID=UPI002DBE20A8|nr:hypothetical protein [Schinkia azotoformans]MEC1726950.1 hypothetical protein [Schinkia azotoformans]